MGLGPGLQLKVSQSLVMSQQLQAAIKLLALSNLELDAVIAEEMAKNPLLEVSGGEGREEGVVVREDRETGEEAADPTGSDELISALGGSADSPLDMDWTEAALDTDSAIDVAAPASDEAFDFDRLAESERGLTEHLLDQLRGSGGPTGRMAEAIVRELEVTGYLETP